MIGVVGMEKITWWMSLRERGSMLLERGEISRY